MTIRRNLLGTTALATLMALAGSGAAQAQAVAYPNLTVGGFAGWWDSDALGAVEGRFTTPIGPALGGQIDGIFGYAAGEFAQVAGHAFYRNPQHMLLGVYNAWTLYSGVNSYRLGGEGELYLGNFTLSAVGGWRWDDNGETDWFTQAKVSLYLGPNTKIFGGYIYEGESLGNVGFEHLMHDKWALFGEARFGNSTSAGWLGLRVYFGNGTAKTLMAREREDVAPLWLHVVGEQVTPAASPGPPTSGPVTTAAPTTAAPTTPEPV